MCHFSVSQLRDCSGLWQKKKKKLRKSTLTRKKKHIFSKRNTHFRNKEHFWSRKKHLVNIILLTKDQVFLLQPSFNSQVLVILSNVFVISSNVINQTQPNPTPPWPGAGLGDHTGGGSSLGMMPTHSHTQRWYRLGSM